MCGVVGEIRFDKQDVNKDNLVKMMETIKHRGPDDNGYFIDNGIGLGFVRLSIIDLSNAGHQPMLSDDGNLVLTFNGEIYNYIELREELESLGYKFKTKTDSEVLLKSFQEWGDKCLDRLNGMWAFIIYNKDTKEVFGARDRFGIKPLYYYMDNEKFIYASEIKAIKQSLDKKLIINEEVVFNYLVYSRTDYNENTFYKEIKKLSSGHYFKITRDGKFNITRWYDLKDRCNKEPIDSSEYLKKFISSIKLRLRSDVPIGICLSGGLDSSSIVSTIVKKLNVKDIHTFSAIYKRGQKGDESEYIDEMKSYLNNMHFITPDSNSLYNDLHDMVKYLDEPVPTTSIYAQYSVMKLAQKDVVVTLDGQGADEQLAGYHYFYGFYFKELLMSFSLFKLISEVYYYISKHKSLFAIKSFIFFLLPNNLKTKLKSDEKSYIKSDFYNLYSKNNILSKELYGSKNLKESLINHFEYKLEHLLKWSDLNSMRFSIESRVPFLDYRLVEQTLSQTNESYIKKGLTKYILREAMKNILPEKIRVRYDKIGFETPEDEWFRDKFFQEFIFDILQNSSNTFNRFIDKDIALNMYKRHINREINCSKEIWKWINLELWIRDLEN